MKISANRNGSTLEVALEGRLDTATAPELDQAITPALGEIEELIIDCGKLDYVSSAGLRQLLRAHRSLKRGGQTKIRNANQIVKSVLDITGMTEFVTIE